MILNKIFRHFKENKILDLKYIIVEIALIFAGITLAAKYNNYQNQLKDEAFLKETMIQIHEEFEKNIDFATRETKAFEKYKNTLILTKNILVNQNKDSLSLFFFKENLSSLSGPFHIRKIDIGYKTLLNKDISLIKNKKIRFELIKYFDEYDITLQNINYINYIQNQNLLYLKDNVKFVNLNKDEIDTNDYKFYFNNQKLLNCFNFSISCYENYIFENEYFNIKLAKELIKNLEKEYPYLKEENK